MVMDGTLVQAYTDIAYRGRVLSVSMMMWGLTPLGTIPSGALADQIGVPWVIIVQGAMVALLIGIMGLLRPEIKRLS